MKEKGKQKKAKAKWTFMIYMAGDNTLSTAGDKDLKEMRKVGSTADVNVVAEFDNAGNRGTKRYHVKRKGVKEHVVSLGETDSGDPKVLIDFIGWVAKTYPAERYALVLWNHGGGWEPSEMDKIARSVKADNYSGRENSWRRASSMGRTFFRTTLEKIYSLQSVAARAICSDDGSGHSLDTIELGEVLAQAVKLLKKPLDILGMDACLMSDLEVAYQAQPYVKYIVASEESEPNEGWPYDAVLHELVANPDQPTPDLATRIVNAYVNSYTKRGYTDPVTQSALDLSKIDELTKPLDDLSEALIPRMASTRSEMDEALYATKAKFYYNTLWDVANLCEELAVKTKDDVIRQSANEVRAKLQPNNKSFVIAEAHNGTKVERCGGVTIYLPPRVLSQISRYYGDLAYAKDHRWLAMLQAYQAT